MLDKEGIRSLSNRVPFLFLLTFLFVSSPLLAGGRIEQDVEDLRQTQEANNKILADTVQNVDVMRREIQELKGVSEEVHHFTSEDSNKNEKLLKDFDLRLTAMEEKLSLYGTQLQEFLTSSGGPHKKQGKQGKNDEEDVLYRRALSEVNAQNNKGALDLFDEFLKKYPKSTLADNAQYWKGEALYASRDFPQPPRNAATGPRFFESPLPLDGCL